MPAASTKANYKTYEAQARMVRAIVAAHPEVKWNYKEISACYGSDMTEHALNHRFRKLRAQAVLIQDARRSRLDMKNMTTDESVLPQTQDKIDRRNIAKYFGQSTADGIQFQFRQIKRDAQELRDVERNGGNVAGCLNLGAGSNLVPTTPSKSTAARSVGGSRSTGKRSRVTPASSFIKRSESDEEDEDEADFSGMDETPSKRTKTTGRAAQSRTPSRKAATKANATIAAAAQRESSASPEDMPTPTPTNEIAPPVFVKPESVFGSVKFTHPSYGVTPSALDDDGYDQSASNSYSQSFQLGSEFDDGDGEI
ncbi:hypothetical protein B0T10DRAFT_457878 [Thelonectria olida]|uniref:Uncharacterized protein n=1 Tax=Thelonectria olida TaxID=1576542 RepID=A0A9P8W6Y2_9HYPO|nr:hypothetical protein B0T10DRAFT_457878 [Thelonectria olida]